MDGREIPGYFFDRERAKYFKIEHARHAPRPDSKYTTNNVRKEIRKQAIAQRLETTSKRCRCQTIVRILSQDSLMYASVQREIGLRSRISYMRTVWPTACTSGLSYQKPRGLERSSQALRYFDLDFDSQTLYAVHGNNVIKRQKQVSSHKTHHRFIDDPDHTNNQAISEPWDEIARLTSEISSLTYMPKSGALAATTRGSDRPPIVYFSDPGRDDPYVSLQFTPRSIATIFGASARPQSSTADSDGLENIAPAADADILAVAGGPSLLLFERLPSGQWESSTALKLNSDILSLDWLSHTVIALGCRNGKIQLYDTRVQGSSHILTHSTPIIKLRCADNSTRLVCSGLEHTLCMYDMRSSRTSTSQMTQGDELSKISTEEVHTSPGTSTLRRDRGHKRRKTDLSKKCSQPIIVFQHSNLDDHYLDIDVKLRHGLLAAAQDTMDTVLLHNIWTGKVAKSLKFEACSRGLSCLKSMDGESFEAIELWVNRDNEITTFQW